MADRIDTSRGDEYLVRALKALPPVAKRRVIAAAAYRGMNQADLAEKAGIQATALSVALQGRRELSDEQKDAIADGLGFPKSVLFPSAA